MVQQSFLDQVKAFTAVYYYIEGQEDHAHDCLGLESLSEKLGECASAVALVFSAGLVYFPPYIEIFLDMKL